MRVVHLVQDRGIRPNGKKGAAVHVTAMCQAFRDLGSSVVQIHASAPADVCATLEAVLADGPIDLVYERYALAAFEGARFAATHRIPHVLEVNAPLEDEARQWRGDDGSAIDTSAERQALRAAHRVLCVSQPVVDYALRRGARPEAILLRPNGVDENLFRPMGAAETRRAEWFPGLDQPFIVGFHGRLRPWHGFDRIARACRSALDGDVNLGVLCVGEGDYAKSLEDVIPGHRWRHVPWCSHEEMATWVAGFDALVLGYDPSADFYFSPLKLREAMAAEVCPVVPKLGQLPESVGFGRAGVVYDPYDESSLPEALTSLARAPERRAELGREARNLAIQTSWSGIARDVLDTLIEAKC